MKFEGSGPTGTRVIERKRSVTDGQTDRRTRQKQYISPRGGRHKYVGVSIGSSWLTQTCIDIRLSRNVVKRPQMGYLDISALLKVAMPGHFLFIVSSLIKKYI